MINRRVLRRLLWPPKWSFWNDSIKIVSLAFWLSKVILKGTRSYDRGEACHQRVCGFRHLSNIMALGAAAHCARSLQKMSSQEKICISDDRTRRQYFYIRLHVLSILPLTVGLTFCPTLCLFWGENESMRTVIAIRTCLVDFESGGENGLCDTVLCDSVIWTLDSGFLWILKLSGYPIFGFEFQGCQRRKIMLCRLYSSVTLRPRNITSI